MPLTNPPSKRRRITAGSLHGFSVGLIALLVIVVGGVIWFEREQAIAQAERNARNLDDVLAAQTREQFKAIDKSLTAIMQRIHPDVIADDDQSGRTFELLRDALRTAPSSVLFYYMVAPDGRMLNTSLDPIRSMLDLSARPGFRLQRDDPSVPFFISQTLRGTPNTLTDRLIFSVNRRITRSDGSFGGLVSALIAVDLLTDLYDGLNVGEAGVVSLIHRQGHMLARSPIDERVIGSDFSKSNIFVNGVNKAPVGSVTANSVADGRVRVTAYRVVDDFPLVVNVGLLLDAELSSWRRYATISATATLAVAALILLLLSFMQRRIRQSVYDEERFIEAELRRKEELEDYSRQLLKAQEMARMGSWRVEVGGRTMQVSPTMQRIVGLFGNDVIALDDAIGLIHPEDKEAYFAAREMALATRQPQQLEFRIQRAGDGVVRHLLSELQFEYDDTGKPIALFAIAQDITERKTTEEQLRQSQKMETIGHLTGGVAHDFNNLLMVVMGNLDLLLDRLKNDPDTSGIVNAAISAAERGAALTRQLLAYARRQPLAPSEIDVNAAVQGISRLLRRTLGEQIEIETVLGGGLWHALADATQVENAVINLAINARDAMPTGGKLTLETANASFDKNYAGLNDEVAPGQYVLIAVTDTGTGMPPEIVARAFEPFFTTKPVGRGTGLGLSMVYGFAKQSGGHAKIYSELGHGTTVKLYLPRARTAAMAQEQVAVPSENGGNEIILVVEDDELVRSTVERMLKELGYGILLAPTAEDALPILDSGVHIDLLFTDVVLPGKMGGKALAQHAQTSRPGLPVLYSSGYTQNSIIHQGRLDSDVELLSKPYKKADLARRLRAVLNKRKA